MAIGLAEAIIESGDIIPQNLGDQFRKNFEQEPWRGYASGPPTVFSLVRREGISYKQAAQSLFNRQGSLGNGGAMRIAPVGLFYYDDKDLYEKAVLSAEVTHAHPVGIDGAAVQAKAVAEAVKLDSEKKFSPEHFIHELIEFSKTDVIRSKMKHIRELIRKNVLPGEAAASLGRSVAVHESMPFAIFSFLRYPDNFKEALYCSILNGGDRDTLGAMTGSLSGAYLGITDIPSEWRVGLENSDFIESLAMSLYNRRKKS
jgi:poly(ADP-ribose) glycohydrolase ARH3